jgi:hypothetical protein
MRRRAVYWSSVAAGIGVGLIAALGLRSGASCPPPGEGRVWCQLQGGVVLPLTLAVAGLVLGHLVGSALTRGLPGLLAHLRAGDRLRIRRGPVLHRSDDPRLMAASWVHVGDVHSEREKRRAQLAWWHAASRPAATARFRTAAPSAPGAPSAGALPIAAVSARSRRSARALCPSCLVWHPLEKVDDGCPACGAACVIPPRVVTPPSTPARAAGAARR